jgi:hypothetical protein
VPSSPTVPRSARTTVSAPPTTVPSADIRQCTSATAPHRTPSASSSWPQPTPPNAHGGRLATVGGTRELRRVREWATCPRP